MKNNWLLNGDTDLKVCRDCFAFVNGTTRYMLNMCLVNIMCLKIELYGEYCVWFEKEIRTILQLTSVEEVVATSYEKFVKLWNAIYPSFINRSFNELNGKCDTCYEIDSMRKRGTSAATLEALKQLHHMHRGG